MTFSGFEPRSFGKQNCSDEQVTGQASSIYSYIAKLSNDDSEDVTLELEVKPCTPYYHSTAQIDSLQINTSLEELLLELLFKILEVTFFQ
jgi:hypothetical protein